MHTAVAMLGALIERLLGIDRVLVNFAAVLADIKSEVQKCRRLLAYETVPPHPCWRQARLLQAR